MKNDMKKTSKRGLKVFGIIFVVIVIILAARGYANKNRRIFDRLDAVSTARRYASGNSFFRG